MKLRLEIKQVQDGGSEKGGGSLRQENNPYGLGAGEIYNVNTGKKEKYVIKFAEMVAIEFIDHTPSGSTALQQTIKDWNG